MRTGHRQLGQFGQLGLVVGALLAGVGCAGQVSSGAPGTGGDGTVGPGTGGTGQGMGGVGGPNTGSGGAGGTPVPACAPLAAIPQRLWRLSANQYANATRDLLTLTTTPTIATSTDGNLISSFYSDASLQIQPAFLTTGLYPTAENVITQITPRLTQLAACTTAEMGTAAGQKACAQRFAQTFGARAFRRPLDPAEVSLLVDGTAAAPGPYTVGAMQSFNTGISLMIEALILSPSFLYRSEIGAPTLAAGATGTLTPYEVATQLGFLFFNSTPDAPLLAAAGDTGPNGLGTPAGIAMQVTRLLALPAVKTSLTDVMVNWFNVRQGVGATHDAGLFSSLAVADQDQLAIQGELITSVQQFVTDTLWTNPAGKITDLLTSQKIFVKRRLATLYGLPFTGSTPATFVSATWPAEQQRIGMLSQPAVLWGVSHAAVTSRTLRGKQIHDDVICQDPLGPPIDLTTPNARAILAMGDSEATKSNARMNNAPCNGCHVHMDPYAKPLENFDPIGGYRTVDEVGRPTDTMGTYVAPSPLAGMAISGSGALGQALLASGRMSDCAVQRMTSYAIGASIPKYNTCEIKDLRTQFAQSDGTITTLFSELAVADFLRTRTGGVK